MKQRNKDINEVKKTGHQKAMKSMHIWLKIKEPSLKWSKGTSRK